MKQIGSVVMALLFVHLLPAQPRPEEVKSVDGIMKALYEVISGEAGESRNWERFHHLFHPEARLIPTQKTEAGAFSLRILTPGSYQEMFQSRISTGFFERELSRTIESYGTLVHVFSTYETRTSATGPVTNRGINSIQLFFDGTRYHIISIFWSAESMGFPLAPQYTKSKRKRPARHH